MIAYPLNPASNAVAREIRQGAGVYRRERDLRRLIAVAPDIVADKTEINQRIIVSLLARSLRLERQRGKSGHWTYDLNRHIGLAQAFAAESRVHEALRPQKRQSPPPEGRRSTQPDKTLGLRTSASAADPGPSS